MAHGAVGPETAIQLDEIDGALALVDLDGVPAAECDVRTTFAGEVNEIALSAGAATWPGLGGRDLGVLVRPLLKPGCNPRGLPNACRSHLST